MKNGLREQWMPCDSSSFMVIKLKSTLFAAILSVDIFLILERSALQLLTASKLLQRERLQTRASIPSDRDAPSHGHLTTDLTPGCRDSLSDGLMRERSSFHFTWGSGPRSTHHLHRLIRRQRIIRSRWYQISCTCSFLELNIVHLIYLTVCTISIKC